MDANTILSSLKWFSFLNNLQNNVEYHSDIC